MNETPRQNSPSTVSGTTPNAEADSQLMHGAKPMVGNGENDRRSSSAGRKLRRVAVKKKPGPKPKGSIAKARAERAKAQALAIARAKAKAKRARGRKKRVAKTRAVAARVEKYHALFSRLFHDKNPRKRYPSYAGIAEELGYSLSMVRRDIFMLQTDYELPLDIVPEYGGWGYTQEVVQAPTVRMTKSQLVLICTAWKSLECFKGVPYAEQAAEAFEKLIEVLGPDVALDLKKVRERISFQPTSYYAEVDPEVFEEVAAALYAEEEMKFDYQKLRRGPKPGVSPASSAAAVPRRERRHVQPRHLLHYDGAWYLFTDDAEVMDQPRKFSLSRMKSALRTGVRFVEQRPFEIKAEIGPGFGVHSGKPQTVRLRFHGVSAELVAEKHYHGTKWMQENADGSLDLAVETVIGPELKRWVLGWGAEAEVLEPATLRDELAAEVERMRRRLAKGGG